MRHKTLRDSLKAVLKNIKIWPASMTHLVAIYGNGIFFFYTEPFQLASETNIAGDLKAHVGRKEGGGLKFIRKEDGCEETRKSE